MRAAALVLVLLLPLGGCHDQQSVASADCTRVIRAAGTEYASYAFTTQRATEHGTALEAECHDTGQDPTGSVFTDDSPTVVTWAFRGYSADQVLGVRQGKRSYAVFVASSVPDAERDRILAALQ